MIYQIMNKEDSFENPKVIKEYLLKLMIKNINHIDNNYSNCNNVLLKMDDKFKNRFLQLLKETLKEIE